MLRMPIDMRGVHQTLGFHDIPNHVRDTVARTLKDHGHEGVEVVMEKLRQLPKDQQLDARHLAHVEHAIEKHTSSEGM